MRVGLHLLSSGSDRATDESSDMQEQACLVNMNEHLSLDATAAQTTKNTQAQCTVHDNYDLRLLGLSLDYMPFNRPLHFLKTAGLQQYRES